MDYITPEKELTEQTRYSWRKRISLRFLIFRKSPSILINIEIVCRFYHVIIHAINTYFKKFFNILNIININIINILNIINIFYILIYILLNYYIYLLIYFIKFIKLLIYFIKLSNL